MPGPPADGGAGLLRVDHIAQTMQHEEMLSWLLYYYALFDVAKTPLDRNRRSGRSRSEPGASVRDGGLRLTLNSSASHADAVVAVPAGIPRSRRSAHCAGDRRTFCVRPNGWRSWGSRRCPFRSNYYEDLEARFGLDGALLERLAELNILYDRDTDGEYFQLYSRAFAKRFFFEFVERRDYRGYGAANAADSAGRAVALSGRRGTLTLFGVALLAHQRMIMSTTTSRRRADSFRRAHVPLEDA